MTNWADPIGVWRLRLLDTTRCPACGVVLAKSTCGACGVSLAGAAGQSLFDLSAQAAEALQRRDELLDRLRAEASARRAGWPQIPVPPPGVGPFAAPGAAPIMTPPPVPGAPSVPGAAPMAPPPSAPGAPSGPGAVPGTLPAPGAGPMAPSPSVPGEPSGPGVGPATHTYWDARPELPPTPAQPSLLARIGVQGVLVALGGLLLAVSGIVFLVFAWDRLSLGGRAAITGGITLCAMAGAAWLQSRLAETAEAIAVIAAVLILGDAWAVRATGLFGADRLDAAGYSAFACVVCALVLLPWGARWRLSTGTITACLLGPLAPVLAGVWLAPSRGVEPVARAAVLGLIGGVAVTIARRVAPDHWTAERELLRAVAVGMIGASLLATLVVTPWPGSTALLLVLVALVSAAQVGCDRSVRWLQDTWSFVAGASVALAAASLTRMALERGGIPDRWLMATAPAAAAVVALGLTVAVHRTDPGRDSGAVPRSGPVAGAIPGAGGPLTVGGLLHRAAEAARAVAVVIAVPAGATVAALVIWTASRPVPPWRWHPGSPLGGHLTRSITASWSQAHLAAVLGLLALALLTAVSRPGRWTVVVPASVGLAMLGAPLQPSLPVAVVVPLLVLVAVVAGAVSERVGGRAASLRRTLLAVASVAGTLAVVLSWSVRELSVPTTVVGIAALLLARRLVARPVRTALFAVAVASTTVAAGGLAGLLGAAPVDQFCVAGVLGSLLAGTLTSLPAAWLFATEDGRSQRLAGLVAGLVATAAGLVAAVAWDPNGATGSGTLRGTAGSPLCWAA